jgi:hypothetical protein
VSPALVRRGASAKLVKSVPERSPVNLMAAVGLILHARRSARRAARAPLIVPVMRG